MKKINSSNRILAMFIVFTIVLGICVILPNPDLSFFILSMSFFCSLLFFVHIQGKMNIKEERFINKLLNIF